MRVREEKQERIGNIREKKRERETERLPQKHRDPEIQRENHRNSEKPRKAGDNGELVIHQWFLNVPE